LRRVVLAVAAVVLLVDQLTKAWALRALGDGSVVVVVPDVLQLRLVFNPGAAFGVAEGYTVVISLVAAAVVVTVVRVSARLQVGAWALALGGLLGGALGNLTDRILRDPGPLRGYVIDFLEAEWPWPGFPVFNVADMAIVGSVGLVMLLTLRGIEYDGAHRRVADADPADDLANDAADDAADDPA
jgi:signal peptidase II